MWHHPRRYCQTMSLSGLEPVSQRSLPGSSTRTPRLRSAWRTDQTCTPGTLRFSGMCFGSCRQPEVETGCFLTLKCFDIFWGNDFGLPPQPLQRLKAVFSPDDAQWHLQKKSWHQSFLCNVIRRLHEKRVHLTDPLTSLPFTPQFNPIQESKTMVFAIFCKWGHGSFGGSWFCADLWGGLGTSREKFIQSVGKTKWSPPSTLQYFFWGVGKKCPRNISPDHVKYNSPTCFFGWQKRLGGRPDARL